MADIAKLITVEYINGVFKEGRPVEEIIGDLENRGFELGQIVDDLDGFEGESIVKESLRILKTCPMTGLLNELKRLNNGELPQYFKDVVNQYKTRYPRRAGILHPLCIVHQIVRKTFGMNKDKYFEQIACRSASSGEVVFCEDGLVMAGLSEDEARSLIANYACLYYLG